MSAIAVIQKCVGNIGVYNGCKVPPHPNIAFAKPHGNYISDGRTDHFSTICNLRPDLGSFLDKHGNEETVKIILLQLTHALDHMHEKGWSHGEINLSNIFLSDCQKKIVLKHSIELSENDKKRSMEEEERVKIQKEKDVTKLRTVFDTILKMNDEREIQGTDCLIAEDLLEQMRLNKVDTKQILQHPYFWDVEKKLTFLSKITQFSKSGDIGKPIKDDLNIRSKDVFGAEGWTGELEINDDEELDRYKMARASRAKKSVEHTAGVESRSQLKLADSRKGDKRNRKKSPTVSSGAIKKFTDKAKCKDEPLYKEHELQSLLNFIRNRWEHYWEDSLEVQACFGYDHDNGFWKFFSKRFPKLLPVVYDVIRSQKIGWGVAGITDVYFEVVAKNEDLPKI